jgi:hypothetical protein
MAKGKTIAGLILELRTFDDQDLEVRLSTDDGVTTHPISLIGRHDGACVLLRCLTGHLSRERVGATEEGRPTSGTSSPLTC